MEDRQLKAKEAADNWAKGLYALDYEVDPRSAYEEGYEQALFDSAKALQQARQDTWKAGATRLREKSNEWRGEGERWNKKAGREDSEVAKAMCYSDRDSCFAKMSAALTMAIEFEAAAQAQGVVSNSGDK